MAGRMGVIRSALVVAVVVGALLHGAAAQTTHVVGDSMGWLVPPSPGSLTAYSNWASTQTFSVGDILVFNFINGTHNVAKVTKAGFDACNASSTIGSVVSTSPARITLDSAGEHYFICTFNGHCSLGQKLAINVTAAPSPASPPTSSASPPSSTPSPVSAPTPSRAPVNYVVGDGLGWLVPPGGSIAYATWAFNKTFMVGDTLVFNFTTVQHAVAEVTKAAFDSCNTTSTKGSVLTTSPARITLEFEGAHYYICTFSGHCPLGQKLAINVTAASGTIATPQSSMAAPQSGPATPPSSTATPPSSTETPPSGTPSSPTPTAGGSTTPPSSAQPLAAAGFSVTLLSTSLAFFL